MQANPGMIHIEEGTPAADTKLALAEGFGSAVACLTDGDGMLDIGLIVGLLGALVGWTVARNDVPETVLPALAEGFRTNLEGAYRDKRTATRRPTVRQSGRA